MKRKPMARELAVATAVAVGLVAFPIRMLVADDLASLLLWVEVGQTTGEAVAAMAEYAETKSALLARPNQIRAEIASCGDCADRARLEQELAQAEADIAWLQEAEQGYAEFMGMDPATAYALGIPMRPEYVKSLPKPCIELYDMMVTCKFNSGPDAERICEPHRRLFNYCQAGDVAGYIEYVEFLMRKARGDVVHEQDDDGFTQHVTYGQLPETHDIPMPDPQSWRREYLVESENTTVDLLSGVYVYPMPLGGPQIFIRESFDPDVKASFLEDYASLDAPMILECRYKADYSYRPVSFWYGRWPGNFDRARYAAKSGSHPLLMIGAPVSECPKWRVEAESLASVAN